MNEALVDRGGTGEATDTAGYFYGIPKVSQHHYLPGACTLGIIHPQASFCHSPRTMHALPLING